MHSALVRREKSDPRQGQTARATGLKRKTRWLHNYCIVSQDRYFIDRCVEVAHSFLRSIGYGSIFVFCRTVQWPKSETSNIKPFISRWKVTCRQRQFFLTSSGNWNQCRTACDGRCASNPGLVSWAQPTFNSLAYRSTWAIVCTGLLQSYPRSVIEFQGPKYTRNQLDQICCCRCLSRNVIYRTVRVEVRLKEVICLAPDSTSRTQKRNCVLPMNILSWTIGQVWKICRGLVTRKAKKEH